MARIDMDLSGGCQCGAVRYHTTQILDNAHICHCRMCQKATGGFFAPLVGMPLDRFEWTRGQPSVFRSSDPVERGFCAHCGTPLFFRYVGGERVSVTIGSLDHPEKVPPIYQLGNESRLPWFDTITHLEGDSTTEGEDAEMAAGIAASNHQHPDHDTDNWQPHG
jgi:hypothetical protein